jgi:hypothetical protein
MTAVQYRLELVRRDRDLGVDTTLAAEMELSIDARMSDQERLIQDRLALRGLTDRLSAALGMEAP